MLKFMTMRVKHLSISLHSRLPVVVCLAAFSLLILASCSIKNPDREAEIKIIEAIKADGRISVDNLNITVEKGFAKVSGEVGSELHPAIITDILERLKKEGVIVGYRNDVTVMDVENPLFQDYTAPLF